MRMSAEEWRLLVKEAVAARGVPRSELAKLLAREPLSGFAGDMEAYSFLNRVCGKLHMKEYPAADRFCTVQRVVLGLGVDPFAWDGTERRQDLSPGAIPGFSEASIRAALEANEPELYSAVRESSCGD